MRSGGSSSDPRPSVDEGPGAAAPILAGLAEITSWQEGVYRQLHQHPELPNHEVRTAVTAAAALRTAGYEVHEQVARRAWSGSSAMARPGRPHAGRHGRAADAGGDGPFLRQRGPSDRPRRQRVPVAHACGHDVHVASLLGAARLLAAGARQHGAARSSPCFSPPRSGARARRAWSMAGLAELIPKPDVALAQHVLAYPSGTVGTHEGPFLSTGPACASRSRTRSHGSMPQRSIDPVVLAAMIVVRLQAIVAREVAAG